MDDAVVLEGDPDRPVIVGRVYNGENPVPHALPDHKNVTTLRTTSTPGGQGYNEIRFTDTAGQEELFIHAQKDRNEIVGNDYVCEVGDDYALYVDGNHILGVLGDQDTSIEGDQDIRCAGEIKLQAANSITLQVGSSIIKITAQGITTEGTTLKSNASEMECGAPSIQFRGIVKLN